MASHHVLLSLFVSTLLMITADTKCRKYESIISFGDSFADTGNLIFLSMPNKLPESAFPPYGYNYFHYPTGRCSDGRIILDFIAEFLGLPYVPPFYGSQSRNFEKGVNYAVGGATALECSFLDKRGIDCSVTNISLGVQIKTFKESLPNLCGSLSDCKNMIGNTLFLMGAIGGNDYNFPLFKLKTVKEVKELVPFVVNSISSAITELIGMGGRTFLVPGDFPLGCSAIYLTLYQKLSNKNDYDPLTGCITWLNEFSIYHNEWLQTELNRLKKLYPHVNIIYADYYNALLPLIQEPTKFGLMNKPLSVCCGVGGQYNFTFGVICGIKGVGHCNDPSKYVNWDGIHMTEIANRIIAEGLLNGPYAIPPFDWSCPIPEIENKKFFA
ncbi:unnamed protein product [Cochlearia groenlandica]